mgnify:CR=1 FL=1
MGQDERATIAAYQLDAAAYREGTRVRSAATVDAIDRLPSRLTQGALVLEIGSGPGHDAVDSTRSVGANALAAEDFSQSARRGSTDRPANAGPGCRSATVWSPCTRTAVA